MRKDALVFAALIWASWLVCPMLSLAQFTAGSLAELRSFGTSLNNSTVTLSSTGGDPHPVTGIVTPGEYWINGDHIADPSNTHPRFLTLGGSGNTYDFSGATINLDTRKLDGYGRGLGHDSGVDVVRVEGSNNLVQGLTLIGQDIALDTDPNAQRYADWATLYVELSGDSNTVDGAHIVARGSRTDTYGLSDAFGKGASQGIQPFIAHRKASNFRVGEATNAVVNDIHLETYSFGHNFFVQGSTNTTLTNSTIKAELFPSQMVLDRSEYQEYGHTWWGEPIPDDIMLAGSEGGVRVYTGSSGLTVDNVTVDGARTGFATVHDGGQVNISNSYAFNTTSGFDVGDNTTITNSGGNIVNGPLLVFYGNGNNTSIDLELTEGEPIGTNWSAAYFNGNADISIRSDLAEGDLPEESYVRLGQSYFENWRDFDFNTATPEDGDPTAFSGQTFVNNTNQILVIGENAIGNVGTSQAPVISNGKENYYDGVTLVPAGTRLEVVHDNGLGNTGTQVGAEFSGGGVIHTGTATASTYDDNGTLVEEGATLEIAADIRVIDERVIITGDGVDGKGAIYSDGTVGNGTRLVGNGNLIILNGDASIGVGVAGNQLLTDTIAGTGNFTKLGPGSLSIGKASTFDGDITIAEGRLEGRRRVVHTNTLVASGATIGAIADYMVEAPTSTITLNGTFDLNLRTDLSVIPALLGQLDGSSSGRVTSGNATVDSGGILEIAGDSVDGSYDGKIDGSISLLKSGENTQSLGGLMTHTGTTTVDNGRLLINGSHTGGDVYTVNDGGALGGSGAIFAEATVTSGGVLAPGQSTGSLYVEDLTLESGSALQIEVAMTDADAVSATLVDLAGDLEIALLDEGSGVYLPESTESFEILTASQTLNGVFANASATGDRVMTAGGEGSFYVVYVSSINSVFLAEFLLAGDYNADGLVDAADYTQWRDTNGQSGLTPYSGADGNGDGQVNAVDLAIWRSNYGSQQGATLPLAVPEPTGVVFAIFAVLLTLPAARRTDSLE